MVSTGIATATPGIDYTPLAPTVVSFAAGQTAKTVSFAVVADTVPEANETVPLNLTAPVGTSVADAGAVAVITDDDAGTPASISVDDVAVAEQDSGPAWLDFTLTRNGDTSESVTVTWSTAAGPPTGTGIVPATAGRDYTAQVARTLTIDAASTSATISVPILPDVVMEPNELLAVNLTASTGAPIADSQAIGTILDDD